MADAAEMLMRVDSGAFVVLFGIGIAVATVKLPYPKIPTAHGVLNQETQCSND